MSDTPSTLPDQEKEHYRALLVQEQRRVAHLSMMNEVQRCILSSPEYESFLPLVTQILQRHFTTCDVAIYLCEPLPDSGGRESTFTEPSDLKLIAWSGQHGLIFAGGSEAKTSTAFALRCIREQRLLCRGFSNRIGLGCEQPQDGLQYAALVIPLIQQNSAFGVLKLCSHDPDGVDAGDVVVLQMICTFLAARIESCLAYAEVRELGAFQQRLFSTMTHSLLVVDDTGLILSANARFCQTIGLPEQELKGARLTDIFDEKVLRQTGLNEALADVSENGVPHELEGVQLVIPGVHLPDPSLVFDIRLFRVFYHHQPQVVLLFINLTSRLRNFHQLQLMSEIGRYFSASLDIDKVLRTVLTCITAEHGLGFNRAFLLLLDEKTNQLKGTLALGAATASEAHSIWHELAQKEWDLQQILEAAENVSESLASSRLQQELVELVIDVNNPLLPALQTSLNDQHTVRVSRGELLTAAPPDDIAPVHREQWEKAAALFNATELVIAPLMAKDRLVGVVLVDNAFSGNLIEESDVQLLDNLAGQAGLTIDNARTYQALQKAQKELVNAERLAVIGDLTARLSHEIRNPLSTIGGFARRLCKNPEDAQAVLRYASVIVEETERLEELLEDLLEMARPGKITFKPEHLSEVINKALLLADADIKSLNVKVETDYDDSLPIVLLDRARLLQALLNIIRNGAQSMPEGGTLQVSTRQTPGGESVQISIRDQGKGISPNAVKHVFDPFYSTKLKGSGLGLAITWRIIQDHGGKIAVESEPGQGTTFIISLPMRTVNST